MTKTVIIVAGGKGTRMKSDIPKQFLSMKGKPILLHTLEAFVNADSEMQIILVLPEDQIKTWLKLCQQHHVGIPVTIAPGGANRFESVKNGLSVASDDGWIGVHDGVRPFIREESILRIYHEAERFGNAVPAIAPVESVRIQTENGNRVIDRDQVKLIQTPQVFIARLLKEAYNRPFSEAFTDDASVFEAAGHQIHLVEGQPGNIKITNPEDLLAD